MTRPGYGRTWWGRVWVETLTERAKLDPSRLVRGRAYAREDRVLDLDICPGAITALVEGSGPRPYRVAVNVPVFDDATWSALLEKLGGQVGHLAALLAGELPPGIDAEVDLLPGAGELHLTCSCGDLVEPCEHAAAVCYLMADVLDTDPFALLLMRGRTRPEVLEALRALRRPVWSAPAGMLAREAFSRALAPPPPPALPPSLPGVPASLPTDPPAAAGVRTAELADLAAGAAHRAWALLRT